MEKPRHRKNPAAVALGLLVVLFVAFCGPARGKGSLYLYNFSGDDSPLHVSVSFTATAAAVSTHLLTQANISDSYMEQGGRQSPLFYLYMPVLSNGWPTRDSDRTKPTEAAANFGLDTISTEGGLANTAWPPAAYVFIERYDGSGNAYPTKGLWSVALVPEPSSLALLLLGLTGLCLRRLSCTKD